VKRNFAGRPLREKRLAFELRTGQTLCESEGWLQYANHSSNNKIYTAMTSYEKHLQGRGLLEYIVDGAVNPEKWAASKVRVLFLLKETYGYQGCPIMTISDCAHCWLDAGIRTYLKSVLLAAAIESALQKN
jgi:hypothetical protein